MSKPIDEKASAASPTASPVTPAAPAPTRRSTLEYFSPARASSQFWRLFSSREKVVENIKTLAWVVPITLIIWIYAEREQVVVPTGPNVQNVQLKITSSDPRLYVEMVGGADQTVNLKLTGPQQNLERVRAQLTSGIPRGVPPIDLGGTMGIGRNQPVNIVDHIQNMDLFKTNGVTVQDAQPSIVYVNIDKIGHRELPVLIPPGIDNLTPDTHFDPPRVTISGPEGQLQQDLDLRAFANLTNNPLLKSEGAHAIPSVPIVLSTPQDKLRIDPVQVRADIVVRALDVPYIIPSMPIRLDIAPAVMKNFDLLITNGEAISNTHVTGPQDKINQLKDGTFQPYAQLQINPEDSANAQSQKKVAFVLPEGVTVAPEDRGYQVEFSLTRKP